MKRVIVIGNKSWEVEPLLNAILNTEYNRDFNGHLSFPEPGDLNYPRRSKQGEPIPRAIWYNSAKTVKVEVWCLQDVMTPTTYTDPKEQQQYYSSSEQKFKDLFKIFEGDNPELVIAFGTAGYPDAISYNGSVVIGSNIFIHDGHP